MSFPSIIRSNSLTDLAARIKAAHEATAIAMQRGLEHAIRAGELLIEAKIQLKHGQWLPWLLEHCAMSERTAQLYMRVAREQAELEASNPQGLADLTLESASKLLAKSTAPESGSWEWAEAQANGPICDWDFETDDHPDWLETKLLHKMEAPPEAAMCFSLQRDYGLPVLRLCSAGAIMKTLEIIAPFVKWKRSLDFAATTSVDAIERTIDVKLRLQALFGVFFTEVEQREKLTEEKYWHQCSEISKTLTERIDARGAELDEIRSIPDEEIKFARLVELTNRYREARQ
jgi:hypothetical protein